MNIENAEKVSILLKQIKEVESQLKELPKHSFWFGTSYSDIDDYLRPHAKFFLEAKLEKLKSELKDY